MIKSLQIWIPTSNVQIQMPYFIKCVTLLIPLSNENMITYTYIPIPHGVVAGVKHEDIHEGLFIVMAHQ